MLSIIDETVERLNRQSARDEKAFGLGSTKGGLKLIQKHFDVYEEVFSEKLKPTKGTRVTGRKKEVYALPVDELTLGSLLAGVGAVGVVSANFDGDDNLRLSNTFRYIGKAMESQCYGHTLRLWNREQADLWEAQLKRASTLAYRQRILKRRAKEKGFVYEDWSDDELLKVGAWVVEGLVAGPLFCFDDEGVFTITSEALSQLDEIMAGLIMSGAFVRPQTHKPDPWSSPVAHIEGFRHPLVRTNQKAVRKFVEREFKTGTISPTLEALTHAQSVCWRINEPILDLVDCCYRNDMGVPGIPRNTPMPVPQWPKPYEQLTEDEVRVHLKQTHDIKTANKGMLGERVILERDLAMANHLRGKPFWTHLNLDYRGRVYGLPHFNFQRSDHIRAMFLFDEGEVLTEDGLYWLKVHLANCGAYEKVDKKPFDERVAWVDRNIDRILTVADDPVMCVDLWSDADSPFMFVAACMALRDGLDGKPVHLPCNWDGSCSGLQHLCAMTKADEGKLVNLTPGLPQDVYQTVANRVKERIQNDTNSDDPAISSMANMCINYGINRSLVKRNVMTYSYSSKKSGMKDQIMDDTMKPLRFKVMTGDITHHPFGDDFMSHFEAARYLAHHTYEAIEEVVQKPAQAMKFLQQVARLYAHEGKPTVWHTPLGFPVMLRYQNQEKQRVMLFLHDKGISRPVVPTSYKDGEGINKRKAASGIAPSFVHSMDACHLMMVVLACRDAGINSVALVHDSFGCLPNHAPRFRELIKETFYKLYTEHDVLDNFRTEASVNLTEPTASKLPDAPTPGNLDLSLIMEAGYCFA